MPSFRRSGGYLQITLNLPEASLLEKPPYLSFIISATDEEGQVHAIAACHDSIKAMFSARTVHDLDYRLLPRPAGAATRNVCCTLPERAHLNLANHCGEDTKETAEDFQWSAVHPTKITDARITSMFMLVIAQTGVTVLRSRPEDGASHMPMKAMTNIDLLASLRSIVTPWTVTLHWTEACRCRSASIARHGIRPDLSSASADRIFSLPDLTNYFMKRARGLQSRRQHPIAIATLAGRDEIFPGESHADAACRSLRCRFERASRNSNLASRPFSENAIVRASFASACSLMSYVPEGRSKASEIVAAANRDFQCLDTFPAWFGPLMSFPQASCAGAARPEQLAPLVISCSCSYSLAFQDEGHSAPCSNNLERDGSWIRFVNAAHALQSERSAMYGEVQVSGQHLQTPKSLTRLDSGLGGVSRAGLALEAVLALITASEGATLLLELGHGDSGQGRAWWCWAALW
ncbi:hypothetical protein L1887_55546 [Cichorium endivia]|nr:hypothetical protein L1887_55546 [Cichorium endivia]